MEEKGHDGQLIRVLPAGTEGVIRHAWPDGTRRAELVTTSRSGRHDDDGDVDDGLASVTLADGQCEVIPSLCRNWTLRPGVPFATLAAVTGAYLADGAGGLTALRQRAGSPGDEETRRFKDQLRTAIMAPGNVPADKLPAHARRGDGGLGAFLPRLWRDLHGDERVPAGGYHWARHPDGRRRRRGRSRRRRPRALTARGPGGPTGAAGRWPALRAALTARSQRTG